MNQNRADTFSLCWAPCKGRTHTRRGAVIFCSLSDLLGFTPLSTKLIKCQANSFCRATRTQIREWRRGLGPDAWLWGEPASLPSFPVPLCSARKQPGPTSSQPPQWSPDPVPHFKAPYRTLKSLPSHLMSTASTSHRCTDSHRTMHICTAAGNYYFQTSSRISGSNHSKDDQSPLLHM